MHGWFGVEVSPAISSLFGFVRRFESPDPLAPQRKICYATPILVARATKLDDEVRI